METKNSRAKLNRFRWEHWNGVVLGLLIYDIITINAAYFLALLLRFDFRFSSIPENYFHAFTHYAPLYTVVCIIVYYIFRLYHSIWRFASYDELKHAACATVVTGLIQVLGCTALYGRMPISYYVFGILAQGCLMLGVRFSYRFVLLLRSSRKNVADTKVMLIGAGESGKMILSDITTSKYIKEKVVCIIDDNPNKWGRYINGVRVVGGRDLILDSVKRYNVKKIYIAIPSATSEQRRDIINICQESNCEIKNLPGMYQFMTDQIQVAKMKDVSVEDLLGREPIRTDMEEVFNFITGKVIMVTGGGGSIGSELCRQML